MPLTGWKSITLKETTVKRLTKIAGEIQEKTGEKTSLDKALESVLKNFDEKKA